MAALGAGGSLVMAQGAAGAAEGLTNGTEPSPAVVRAEHLTVAGALDGGDAQAPGRRCYRLNEGWDFVRGGENPPAADAFRERVTLPHAVDEVLPVEASGGRNYQGPAWYRRSFELPKAEEGRRRLLYFEGVMGRCRVFVDGVEVGQHLGGYLPAVFDVTEVLRAGGRHEVMVCADNSDDRSFPPGKPQDALDFTYFGGLYRDAWLVTLPEVAITDPHMPGVDGSKAGVFFRTMDVGEDGIDCRVWAHVRHFGKGGVFRGQLRCCLEGLGEPVCQPVVLRPQEGSRLDVPLSLPMNREWLWSPEHPVMQVLRVELCDEAGKVLDCRRVPVGIRTVRWSPQGLFINNERYRGKLLGANRHQDYALVGHALPNNLQVEDVHKLHDAGMRIIRLAHTPADPAFMDACDRLGMMVIVPTPGWQFCGDARFVERVYDDVRAMIRRDRNHPSVVLWEPVLNETHTPADFARRVTEITQEEFPVPGCAAACDSGMKGRDAFQVLYAHPPVSASVSNDWVPDYAPSSTKAFFTREWGDNVDDWSSHNSSSRASRRWGEGPMLVQARHYMNPPYVYSCWKTVCEAPSWHLGGAIWHSFDHQRGYHPDPFYGGIMDAWRQPKLAYYAFMAQRPQCRPMVFIAHAMTPFSPGDVTVFSNCDEVRLVSQGRPAVSLRPESNEEGTMHLPVVFEGAWEFQRSKGLTRKRKLAEDVMVAEGLIDGKVVCRDVVRPARRPSRLRLRVDASLPDLRADGSSLVPVVAEVTDDAGSVKRLSNEWVQFSVEGAGVAVDGAPRQVEWGSAPLLIRVGDVPGEIRVRARLLHEGSQAPQEAPVLVIPVGEDDALSLPPAG